MAGDTRVGDRQAALLRIKLKYPSVDTFIEKYAVNISRGGIFIASRTPKPVGTTVRFEFLLAAPATAPAATPTQAIEGASIIRGEGQVQWVREFDPAAPQRPHGMGLRFTHLDGDSQKIIDRALAWRQAHLPQKGDARDTSGLNPLPTPTKPAEAVVAAEAAAVVSAPIEAVPAVEAAPTPAPAPSIEAAAEAAPTLGRVALKRVAVVRGQPIATGVPVRAAVAPVAAPEEALASLVAEAGLTDAQITDALTRLRARGVSPDFDLAKLFD